MKIGIDIKALPVWHGIPKYIFIVISTIFSSLVIYWGIVGVPVNYIHRPTCLAFALVLGFMFFPSKIFQERSFLETSFNLILILLSIISSIWVILTYERIEISTVMTNQDLFWAGILALLVLDLTRRAVSPPLAVVGMLALLYAYFGSYLPNIFAHRGYSIPRILIVVSTGGEGIFSSVLAGC